jgi:hypothetical protein
MGRKASASKMNYCDKCLVAFVKEKGKVVPVL